jgi:hypothetical protein
MPAAPATTTKRLKRVNLKILLAQLGSHLLDILQPIIIFGGMLLVIGLKIPWLSGVLANVGVKDRSGVSDTVVVVTLAAIFIEMRSLAQRIGERRVYQQHVDDAMDVYPILLERMRAVTKREEKRIEVLGMSLYTAWPSIRFWLNRPELAGWTIRLAACASATGDVLSHFPQDWLDEARQNLESIRQAASTPGIVNRGIRLEAFSYDFIPVLHGFRLGNGDLFYSILSFGDDGRINRDRYSYEFVPYEDGSTSAESIREVFESWLNRACRDAWVPAVTAP